MLIMTKKIFREIWRNKFRSISIIIVVAISLGVLAGLRAGKPILYGTYDLNMKINNVSDGTFTFSRPIDETNITSIRSNTTFFDDANLALVEGRIFYITELVYKGQTFKAIVIGIHYPNSLNKLVIEDKASDIDNDTKILDDNTSCIIETRFAGHKVKWLGHDVQLNDKLSIDFKGQNTNFTVKAIAQDSYYTYLVDPVSKMPLLGSMSWISVHFLYFLSFRSQPAANK